MTMPAQSEHSSILPPIPTPPDATILSPKKPSFDPAMKETAMHSQQVYPKLYSVDTVPHYYLDSKFIVSTNAKTI
jgi:hypothetical protein